MQGGRLTLLESSKERARFTGIMYSAKWPALPLIRGRLGRVKSPSTPDFRRTLRYGPSGSTDMGLGERAAKGFARVGGRLGEPGIRARAHEIGVPIHLLDEMVLAHLLIIEPPALIGGRPPGDDPEH
jgi:hypothetical protein